MSAVYKEYREKRDAEEAAEQKRLHEQKRQNDAARKAYLARLDAERDAKRAEQEAKVEAELAPTKTRLQRQWLVDHPDKSAADFDNHAWPLLKANMLEDQREQAIQNEIAAQRRRMGSAI